MAMIIAILERRCGMKLAAEDAFVNIAGGVKVMEPAIDAAIALAIASVHLNRPLPASCLAVGELGLGGRFAVSASLTIAYVRLPGLALKSAYDLGTASTENTWGIEITGACRLYGSDQPNVALRWTLSSQRQQRSIMAAIHFCEYDLA